VKTVEDQTLFGNRLRQFFYRFSFADSLQSVEPTPLVLLQSQHYNPFKNQLII